MFFTLLVVTANSMAQRVRELTAELGVLKTLGFTGRMVTLLVLAESLLLTALGAAGGMALAHVAVDALGGAVRQYLPIWEVPPAAWWQAAVIVLLTGLLAGAAPALRAWRLPIVQALRQV